MDRTYGVSDPIVVVRVRGIGQVYTGACKIHWIACTPSAGLSVWEISDSALAAGAVLLECYSTAKESKGFGFLPPCPFANGIHLNTFTLMTGITIGYSVV